MDEDLEASVHSAVQLYNFRHLDKLIQECQVKLREAKDPEKQDELLQKFMALMEIQKTILHELGIVIPKL
jgi:hypothetical protein